jgi:uncharacterized protein (TIGR04255 family)
MSQSLPFPVPARLPRKIDPCPILEAVMELRFVPKRPYDHFPGLFHDKLKKKYSQELDLGVAQIPQIVRDQNPLLAEAAYRRYVGAKFSVQVGPRMVGLVTQRDRYPGWDEFWTEMSEVLDAVRRMSIVSETVRIGLRYINFFPFNVFDKLVLAVNIAGTPLLNPETGFNTVFTNDGFKHLVQINNSSLIPAMNNTSSFGSILDIDTTSTIPIKNVFSEAKSLFSRAHASEKAVFFGLLKPDYLETLKPIY